MLVKENATIPLEILITDLFSQVRTDISSVYFRIFHRVSGSEVEDKTSTLMSGSNGVYYYSWDSDLSVGNYIIEYTITDNASEVYKIYEELSVGYLESDIQFLKDVEGGKWEISNNVMYFYDATGTRLIMSFNLFDENGIPSSSSVFKRERN